MQPPKVLIADSISQSGIDELSRDNALDVSVQTNLSVSQLLEIVPEFSAIVVRSQTNVTAGLLKAGTRLRVVGRAGVGVDNVDVEAATRRGVVVLNARGETPFRPPSMPFRFCSTWRERFRKPMQPSGAENGIEKISKVSSSTTRRLALSDWVELGVT
jgi:Phosphoglycerate dehydrogenase and related dehydrogenases